MYLVCRITNTLLELRNAGHARYITWSYSFHCEFDVYNALNNQAIKMENELKQWNDEIAKARKNFYVLNLFTAQQLRVISQQLGQVNCDRISSLPSTVISMLMSISPKICEKDIKESLQSVKLKSSLVAHDSTTKSEDLNSLCSPIGYDENVQMSQFNPENEVSMEAAVEKLLMHLIDQLDVVEKEVYDELKKSDYSDNIAYLSIKYCSNVINQQGNLVEATSAWCLENENRYLNRDAKSMLNELQAFNLQNNEHIWNAQIKKYENDENSVVKLQDDDVFLMEKMLIDNDVPSGLARKAAEIYPNDIGEALTYCLNEQNKSTDQSFLQLPTPDGSR